MRPGLDSCPLARTFLAHASGWCGRSRAINSNGRLQRAATETVWSITSLDFTHAVLSPREVVAVGRSLRAGSRRLKSRCDEACCRAVGSAGVIEGES